MAANVIKQNAKLLVHRVQHAGIERVLLAITSPCFGRKERRVNVVWPHIDVKWLAFGLATFNKLERRVGERGGDLRTIFPTYGTVSQFVRPQGMLPRWGSIEGIAQR